MSSYLYPLLVLLTLAAPSKSLFGALENSQSLDAITLPDLSSILNPERPSQSKPLEPNHPFTEQNYLYSLSSWPEERPRGHNNEDSFVAQNDESAAAGGPGPEQARDLSKTVLINFNNVSMIEYIRFVSRISNRNFIFDENDLQFNVTIISEEPATIDNIMAALLQELRIHDLMLIEENNNLIIHRNPKVNSISRVVPEGLQDKRITDADIITQVFRLNTLDPEKAAQILRPLTSDSALIEVLKDSNHLIITDLSSNIQKISQLLKSIDAPNSGVVIGQYVSRLTPIDTLIPLAQQIIQPISQDQTLAFVSQPTTNSIFVISSPFLVERTIAILQYLDQDQGSTRIFNLNDLRLNQVINPRAGPGAEAGIAPQAITPELLPGQAGQPAPAPTPALLPGEAAPAGLSRGISPQGGYILRTPTGEWMPNAQGNWIFKPEISPAEALLLQQQGQAPTAPPAGNWTRDYEGNWNFNVGQAITPGGPAPRGRWVLDKDGNWVYELEAGETFNPAALSRQFQGRPQLPGGIEKKTRFYIYKLQYRKGESIEPILRQIADTIQQNERGNEDLITTLRSVQWLNTPNSLVFSGTVESLDKARALVAEIDKPMRQVFIEMLILESTLLDSLNYGVSYGTRFGGGDTSGAQGFFSGSSPLVGALASTGFTGLGGPIGQAVRLIPNGTNIANGSGFNLGVIGQKITHCGTEFGSIGALVNALHDRSKDKVVSNPKILVEDNSPAEIFVGINTPYRTQSISNDFGSVITSNFEYRDVGTHLKITPYLGNGDIVTLDIEEEVSSIIAGLITNASTASTSPGPTTRINRTTTRVHIPDTYFLIISGMMQNEEARERNQVPCLGGVPLLGAGFSSKINTDTKRNLMIFIRPKIIDTEEEIQNLTKHQQDIYDYKNTFKDSLEYETVEALDLFNIKQTLHPEDECKDEDALN